MWNVSWLCNKFSHKQQGKSFDICNVKSVFCMSTLRRMCVIATVDNNVFFFIALLRFYIKSGLEFTRFLNENITVRSVARLFSY